MQGMMGVVVHGLGTIVGLIVVGTLIVWFVQDVTQKKHSVLRNYPVIGRLHAAAPGLRPPLFYSPYEAAMWSVLSARRPAAQMAVVRDRFSRAHGRVFNLADYVQVKGASFENGLLKIDLVREVPEGMKPRRIEINAGVGNDNQQSQHQQAA